MDKKKKTEEEIKTELTEIVKYFHWSKESFADELRDYEDTIRELHLKTTTLTCEAQQCEDIAPIILVSVAKLGQELADLEKRFNGLKCELT